MKLTRTYTLEIQGQTLTLTHEEMLELQKAVDALLPKSTPGRLQPDIRDMVFGPPPFDNRRRVPVEIGVAYPVSETAPRWPDDPMAP